MDELCVHCGQPITYVRYNTDQRGPVWLHRHGDRLCLNRTGHMACPTEAGIE